MINEGPEDKRMDFQECADCAAKPGSPTFCAACLHNRTLVSKLRRENEALMNVYAVAARLRTSPVPFEDHFELCGAVDACRPVIEPFTSRIYEKER